MARLIPDASFDFCKKGVFISIFFYDGVGNKRSLIKVLYEFCIYSNQCSD